MGRGWWIPILLAACQAEPRDSANGDHGASDTDTDPTVSGWTPTDTAVPLTEGEVAASFASEGVVSCADPGARDAARYDIKNAPEMPLPAAYLAGGGVVAADFTGDGAIDVFIPSEHDYQMWIGNGAGGYDDRASPAFGGVSMDMAVGGSAADYDGDGDLDLLVTRFDAAVMLFRNDGTGVFTDVTTAAGLGARAEKWQSSSWADFDLDGDLDLVVGAYGDTPDDYDAPLAEQIPGQPSALYVNDGDGTFTDRSDMLIDPTSAYPEHVQEAFTFSTAWYDMDGDQYPELFFINDFVASRPSIVLHNVGGQAFEQVQCTGLAGGVSGMGVGVGDVNEDGLPDFFMTSFKSVALVESSNLPSSGCAGPWLGHNWVSFTDRSGIVVDGQQRYGWGTELFDADNDMDLDVVLGTGLWSTYPSNPIDQPDAMYLNDGDADGVFVDVSTTPAWDMDDRGVTRGIAALDLNRDGWVDVIKRDLHGPTQIRTARCGEEGWLELALHQTGMNPDAIGARIRVTAGGHTQTRWIQAGSSSLFTGLAPEAHFGLGDAARVDLVEVLWPDGKVSRRRGLDTRQRLTVTRQD